MRSEIIVQTRFIRIRRTFMRGRITLTLPTATRRVVRPDGAVLDINHWVSRRVAQREAISAF